MKSMRDSPIIPDISDSIARASSLLKNVVAGLETVIRGKRETLEFVCVAAVCGGHVLLEDLPGTGKTTLAKATAALVTGNGGKKPAAGSGFKRVQFTPDLLPYDITGVDVFDPESRKFVFQPGPVFSNILLADEINRATPKVQSALLEAMAESQVTVGLKTYPLPEFFMVLATENPVDAEGTYPLPAAQLDRFMMRIRLGYPNREAELSILRDDPAENQLRNLTPVCGPQEFAAIKALLPEVYCDEKVYAIIQSLLERSRTHEALRLGLSPRSGLMLLKAAKARAIYEGRDYVTSQDLAVLAPPVLAHRIKAKPLDFDCSAFIAGEVADCVHEIEG